METSFLTPSSSVTVLRVTLIPTGSGNVVGGFHYYDIANHTDLGPTTLDLNANKATFLIFLKKIIGFKLANNFNTNEYVKNKWNSKTKINIRTY